MPPDQTAVGKSGKGTVKLAGPQGEELGSVDGDGNRVWIVRDALQRETASWREAGAGTLKTLNPLGGSASRVASRIAYNSAGQVSEIWDMNLPAITRRSAYDVWGRLWYLVINSKTGEGLEYVFGTDGLGRVTELREATLTQAGATWTALTPKVVVQNFYDLPSALAPPGATYRFVAGKLSWTQVPAPATGVVPATGAEQGATFYGYDDAGRIERRDQRFQRIEGGQRVFTVTSTYGGDGRVLKARYSEGTTERLLHTVDYDSAGRPIEIARELGGVASTRFWEAASQSVAWGAYDAAGRIPWIKADDGLVASVREYSAQTGLLRCEWKSWAGSAAVSSSCPVSTPQIAGVVGATYEGTKLLGYTEPVSRTKYTNAYAPSGKLTQAQAVPQGAIGTLTQGYNFQYAFNGIGNLERASEDVTLPAVSSTIATYQPVKASADEAKDKTAYVEHAQGLAGLPALPGAKAMAYAYDIQGHLLTVSQDGTEVERLTYGPTGELVGRQVGSRFTFYVGEYMTVTASGQAGCSGATCAPQPATLETDAHVLLAGTRIASVKPSRTLYYYRSRLGTVVATSLGGGTIGAQYRYDPYGKLQVALNESAATSSELGYTNALRLSGQLVYLKARVYDAESRVFLQADAVDRYRYAYVWGDPANASDPFGLEPVSESGPAGSSDSIVVKIKSAGNGMLIVTIAQGSGKDKKTASAFMDQSAVVEKGKLLEVATGLAAEAHIALSASADHRVEVLAFPPSPGGLVGHVAVTVGNRAYSWAPAGSQRGGEVTGSVREDLRRNYLEENEAFRDGEGWVFRASGLEAAVVQGFMRGANDIYGEPQGVGEPRGYWALGASCSTVAFDALRAAGLVGGRGPVWPASVGARMSTESRAQGPLLYPESHASPSKGMGPIERIEYDIRRLYNVP